MAKRIWVCKIDGLKQVTLRYIGESSGLRMHTHIPAVVFEDDRAGHRLPIPSTTKILVCFVVFRQCRSHNALDQGSLSMTANDGTMACIYVKSIYLGWISLGGQ